MIPEFWLNKPYYSLDAYCKRTYGHKIYKIAIDAHMTCPNRDGKLDTRGCIFCSSGGSGDFASQGETITEQIQNGLSLFGDKNVGDSFIAYFQAYTNTYAPIDKLQSLFTNALSHPKICGISIATRPDCLPEEVIQLLAALQEQFPHKFIWIELGLQTIHEETATFIRRGYSLPIFEKAYTDLTRIGLPCIIHLILGLPGENEKMLYETIAYLNHIHPFGVKLQLLHILEDTDLGKLYQEGKVNVLDKETYLNLVVDCIERLSPDIVIHRVTGDGPKDLLLAPTYSKNKRDMLNSLHKAFKLRNTYQGKLH